MVHHKKKDQRFKNNHGLNDVYCWKNDNWSYSVGINGTSEHYSRLSYAQADKKVSELVNYRTQR